MFRFFENLVDPFAPYEETDRPPGRLWPFIAAYTRPFRAVFATSVALKIIVAASEVALIWYMGRLVDLLSASSPEAVMAGHWREFAVAAILVLFVRTLVAGLDVALLHSTILTNLGTLVRWRAHRHVLRQPVGWFENDLAGRLANRVNQTPVALADAMFQVFDAVAFAITTVVGSAILLMHADPRLALPMAVWIAFYVLLLLWTIRHEGPASTASSGARSAVTGRIVDSYTNIHSVKMFAHHDRELSYARQAIMSLRGALAREMRIIVIMDVALTFLNGALIVSITGLALYLWYYGQTTIGAVAAATALALRLNNMTYWIMWATSTLVQALGVVREGMQTIAQPITLTDRSDAPPLAFSEGRIEIRDLAHHYGRGSGGLAGISLDVQPGEKMGLVGRSGSGKSTLVKLVLRFYDPEDGTILIDGQDITTITQDSLRAKIGMVQQDSSLLHRSVRDNILYGRPTASEAELIEAARRAEAHDFIRALRDPEGATGYDAQVGERGVKLSGGQRQRIAIARVILKNAPILILDEATSALDSEVEAAIQETLYGVMEGKTVIAIAHRLSTIARMDRIVVIDEGRVVEDGTHAALLAQGGIYARLWNRQSGGFLGTDEADSEAAE